MKRGLLWKILAGITLVAIATCVMVESNAETKAKSFCSRFPPRSSMADVANAARNEGDARHRSISDDEIFIAHIGIPPFSRHACSYSGKSGKVATTRYAYID